MDRAIFHLASGLLHRRDGWAGPPEEASLKKQDWGTGESKGKDGTDVNIAVQMMEDGYENRCDQMVLISGDSDLVPAVGRVKALGKKVIVYIPARNPVRGAAVELRSVADTSTILPLTLLKHCQFPATMPDGSGGFLTKPSMW